jgi:phosphoglycerate kinase
MSEALVLPDFRDAPLEGKAVLLRADLNVPFKGTAIADRSRIVRATVTIAQLLSRGARVVILGHLDRPRGVVNPVLSMAPVASALSDGLNMSVRFVPDCVGATAERWTRSLPEGGVALLENLRFHAEEEENDRAFAMMLSVHGDIYVNDAPSCSIRRHASIHALAGLMPAYAGPQLLAHAAGLDETEAMSVPGIEALMAKTRTLEKI